MQAFGDFSFGSMLLFTILAMQTKNYEQSQMSVYAKAERSPSSS